MTVKLQKSYKCISLLCSLLQHEKQIIGMPLSLILKDKEKVPTVVERLIKAIELNGFFTVGVYRKAGAAGKIRELLHLINTGMIPGICCVLQIRIHLILVVDFCSRLPTQSSSLN